VKIKICGLSRVRDILAVNACKPDYAGFVLAPSRRRVSVDTLCELRGMLENAVSAVGVFADETPENAAALLNRGVIDIAQLHGSEDAQYIARLRKLTDKPIIKAVCGVTPESIENARNMGADMLLLDGARGGSGKSFDWSVIPRLDMPWFLAGGLDESNLADAAKLAPYCLDISGGAETDGVKDPEKIRILIEKARSL
jgi:phosphoribosylanthranilate isomerase